MAHDYKEVRGVLVKKYRNVWGKYIFIIDENGMQTKIPVHESFYEFAALGTKWTIGYAGSQIINIRLGICENQDALW